MSIAAIGGRPGYTHPSVSSRLRVGLENALPSPRLSVNLIRDIADSYFIVAAPSVHIPLSVYMYVCMYVCMYVRVCVWTCV